MDNLPQYISEMYRLVIVLTFTALALTCGYFSIDGIQVQGEHATYKQLALKRLTSDLTAAYARRWSHQQLQQWATL